MTTDSTFPRTPVRRARLLVAAALVLATAGVAVVARGHGAPTPPPPPTAAAALTAHGGPISLTARLDRRAVLRGGDGTVRVELLLGADGTAASAPRAPSDLVVVLDRSGSMDGEKITQARAAVRELIGQLGPEDRFALVTYADAATVALPLERADADARRRWLATVDGVAPGGGTNIASGLDLAVASIAASRSPGRVPRAILISDGLANQGDATHAGLVRRAGAAARGEYPLTAVGVGDDFNEDLLRSIADAGTGNYYYLRTADDLGGVFARELDATRTQVASGLAVRITPAPGVRVLDAAGYPLETTGDTVVFRPGALFAGQQRRVWVTLAVPQDALGTRDVGRFALSYERDGTHTTLALAGSPQIACVAGEQEFVAGVDAESWARGVTTDEYYTMQDEVARAVAAGRRDEAESALQRFRTKTEALNARVQSAPVARQLGEADALAADVAAAFSGPGQAAKQNRLAKTRSAEAHESRRAGSKK